MAANNLCETCSLHGLDPSAVEHVVKYCWLRYLNNPQIAHNVMKSFSQETELVPQQLTNTEERFSEEVVRAATQNRLPTEAVTECFLRHESGDCTESQLYKIVTSDASQ